MSDKGQVIVYVVLSLSTIAVLTFLLVRKNTKKENFRKCICSGGGQGRERVCQDTEAVQQAYEKGMTEYSDFKSKGWTKVSPGDMDYPTSSGCPWNMKDKKMGEKSPHGWDDSAFASEI